MYRITSDWHGWSGADNQQGWPNHFRVANATRALRNFPTAFRSGSSNASFPDLDMLHPFTDPESFRMQQTLWSIARSPLVYGGDPRTLDASHPHVVIMTNPDVLAVADGSADGEALWYSNESAAYRARVATTTTDGGDSGSDSDSDSDSSSSSGGGDRYLAFFKFSGAVETLTATFEQAGLPAGTASVAVTDLWSGKTFTATSAQGVSSATPLAACKTDGSVSPTPCTALYRLSPQGRAA
jgi:hypothetical protein